MASGLTPTYQLPYPLQTDPVNVAGDVEDLAMSVDTELALKASIFSPEFTGVPIAPTAATDTSTTQIATTEFVVNQGYLKSAVASTTYATNDSPTLTGTPLAPTASLGTDTTQIATTEYVQNELANFVTLPAQSVATDGLFLKSDGTTASWQQIQASDVSGLTTVIDSLSGTYAPLNANIVTDTAASRVLSLSDATSVIQMNNASANTITIPTNSSVGFEIGASITIIQTGAGQTTIVPDSGVTANGTPGLKLRAQFSVATLIKVSTDVWIVMGDVVA